MNARQLCDLKGDKFNLWLCGECGIIAQERFLPIDTKTGKHIGTVQEAAEACCRPKKCKGCGEIVPVKKRSNYTETPKWCEKCLLGKNAERDRKRLEEAELVEAKDYDYFYYDGPGSCYDGEYCECPSMVAEHFMDAVDDSDDDDPVSIDDKPEFCFVCKPIHPRPMDIVNHFENVDTDACVEDGDCQEHLEGTEELNDAINAFNQANKETVIGWMPDYKRKVRVPEMEEE